MMMVEGEKYVPLEAGRREVDGGGMRPRRGQRWGAKARRGWGDDDSRSAAVGMKDGVMVMVLEWNSWVYCTRGNGALRDAV